MGLNMLKVTRRIILMFQIYCNIYVLIIENIKTNKIRNIESPK